MKKFKLIAVFVLFSLILTCAKVQAVTTYTRNEDNNYGVPSGIKITSSNKTNILRTPLVDADERVYDFANLFTSTQEEDLYNSISDFEETYKMDMVIVTIDDNPANNAMVYADDFFDYNDFGRNSSRDGILFLIDMDTREIYISTSGMGIKMYDDDRIDDILDYAYTDISSQRYYDCADTFIDYADFYASKGYPASNNRLTIDEKGEVHYKKEFPLPLVLVVPPIITLLFFFIASAKHKTISKATQAKMYIVNGSFKLTHKEDRFVGTHTSKVYDPPSESSGGGGSSSHHSSSGHSHGGGGRHF